MAEALFAVMATVFEESFEPPGAAYTRELLDRADVWVIAALSEGQPIAGLTGFVLPLTRLRGAELLIYDIAVRQDHQRRGIGRRLVLEAVQLAARSNLLASWVPASNENAHAIDFYRAIGGSPTPVTIFTFDERG